MSKQQPDELDRLRFHRLTAYVILTAYSKATDTPQRDARAIDVANWAANRCHKPRRYSIREIAALGVLKMNWARDHDREPNEALMLDVIQHASKRIALLESTVYPAPVQHGAAL